MTTMFDTHETTQPGTSKKPAPVTLRTPHDYGLTARLLEQSAETLQKLADKTRDGGYPREASAIEADANAVKHHILPQFRAQQELPLVTREALHEQLCGRLRSRVHRAFESERSDTKGTYREGREDDLVKHVAGMITNFAIELAEAAYAAGLHARESDPEQLASKALDAFSAAEA